jgi:hypothetical protein
MVRSHSIRYLTLIGIPKQHPVFVGVDWTSRGDVKPKELPFVPLIEIEQRILNALKPLDKNLPDDCHYVGQNYVLLGDVEAGTPLAQWPELVLGADLPCSHIKWTKDLRLLIRRDKRRDLRRKAEMSD